MFTSSPILKWLPCVSAVFLCCVLSPAHAGDSDITTFSESLANSGSGKLPGAKENSLITFDENNLLVSNLDKLPDPEEEKKVESVPDVLQPADLEANPLEDTGLLSDRSVKNVVNDMGLFEQKAPHMSSFRLEKIKAFLETYHDNSIRQLKDMATSEMPAELTDFMIDTLDRFPSMRGSLYYPMLVKTEDLATMGKSAIRFDHDLMVLDAHFINTQFDYLLLKAKQQPGEQLVLLELNNSKASYPISRFSELPDNTEFILNHQDKEYKVINSEDFAYGLYDKIYRTKERSISDKSRNVKYIRNNRLKTTCQ